MKINQEITADKILLIDESGVSQGVVSFDQAMFLAYEKGLDLAMVNEKINPPICKLMDYGKYLYSIEKQNAKQKAKTHSSELKEIRLGIKIGEHDLSTKTEQIKKFLDHGDKVKITIQLRGREMMFRDRAGELIEKIKNEAGANFEKPIEKMGNKFFATLVKNK